LVIKRARVRVRAHSSFTMGIPEGKYILENLTNLDQLPPNGASLIALPLKIEGGAESPIRAVGVVSQ